MKTLGKLTLFIALTLLTSATKLSAQKLVIGERVPELKVQQWMISTPTTDGKAVMIEFFHPANEKSGDRLSRLNSIASINQKKLIVVVLVKENSISAQSTLISNNPSYYPAIDDAGKTFTAFGVKYIPYAVIYDKRGRILWIGNPSSISNDEIISYIK